MSVIAVIGHGAGCVGCGRSIDRADTVVRMFDCGWQVPEDHGTKYDVGLARDTGFRLEQFEDLRSKNELRLPAREWWLYTHARGEVMDALLGLSVRAIRARELAAVASGSMMPDGYKFTRGVSAVLFALQQPGVHECRAYGFGGLAGAKEYAVTAYHSKCPSAGKHTTCDYSAKMVRFHSNKVEREAVLHIAQVLGVALWLDDKPLKR